MIIATSSPHAHQGATTSKVMFNVCLALLPCTLFGFYLFAWPAIFIFTVTVVTAIATEAGCLWLMKAPLKRLYDGSALLTGWLIALTLPPWAPWWIGLLGAFFAISIGKQLYGGIGQNVFNPAMLARVGLLIAFPLQMTTWPMPTPMGSAAAPDFFSALNITFGTPNLDGLTGATPLGELHIGLSLKQSAEQVLAEHFNLFNFFFGFSAGSLGETSEFLVLLGGLYLLWRRLISWEIPVAMLATLGFLTLLSSHLYPEHHATPLFHLTSGGIFLGAFFIATDPVTSPISRGAKLVFGAGIAAVMFVIRIWGSFPEAVAFGVLFMNAFTPLLDKYMQPRHYGRFGSGKPIPKPDTKTLLKDAQQ